MRFSNEIIISFTFVAFIVLVFLVAMHYSESKEQLSPATGWVFVLDSVTNWFGLVSGLVLLMIIAVTIIVIILHKKAAEKS